MSRTARKCATVLLSGAVAYALGLLLGWLANSLRPHPSSRTADALPWPGAAVTLSPGNAPAAGVSNSALPVAVAESRPPPLQVLLESLRKEEAGLKGLSFDEKEDLIRGLSARELAQLWQVLGQFKHSDTRETFSYTLFSTWANLNPAAALGAAQSISMPDKRDSAVHTVLSKWAENDSPAALKWARGVANEDRRQAALAAVVSGMAETDPARATRLFPDLTPGRARDLAAASLTTALASEDPSAASRIADQIGTAVYREIAFGDIAAAMSTTDPQAALKWARSLSNISDRNTALAEVLPDIARTDPQGAAALITAEPANPDWLARVLASQWVAQDATAAAQWVRDLPPGATQQEAVQGLLQSWPAEDLESAGKFALSLSDSASRNQAIQELGSQWAPRVQDVAGLLQFAGQFPTGADRDAFLEGACKALRSHHPEASASLVEAMSASDVQSKRAEKTAGSWTRSDPDAAAAWATSLPDGTAHDRALLSVTKQWISTDPEAAGQWLQSLPAGPARDSGVTAYVNKLANSAPALAAPLAETLTDETARNDQVEKLARRWLQTDRPAAEAWLAKVTLPDDRKQRLLQSPRAALSSDQ